MRFSTPYKKPLSASDIDRKVGKIISGYKMAKHFEISIADAVFYFKRKAESIARKAELAGIYFIRTSKSRQNLSARQERARSDQACNLIEIGKKEKSLRGIGPAKGSHWKVLQ